MEPDPPIAARFLCGTNRTLFRLQGYEVRSRSWVTDSLNYQITLIAMALIESMHDRPRNHARGPSEAGGSLLCFYYDSELPR